MAQDQYHFYGWYTDTQPIWFRDCAFAGGQVLNLYPPLSFTNCLFERVRLYLEDIDSGGMNLVLRNCLFSGGAAELYHYEADTWVIRDNVFDRCALAQEGDPGHDFNAYVTNAASQYLTPLGSNDMVLTNLTFQTGSLGRYYLPTNAPMIDAGSVTNADLAGFYHYTTTTNQVKEGTSRLDIGFHYVATTNGVPCDTDNDGLADYVEGELGTDPNDADSDNDGVSDWVEVIQGRNPLMGASAPDTNNVVNLRTYTPLK
jgi:hypothetical protein